MTRLPSVRLLWRWIDRLPIFTVVVGVVTIGMGFLVVYPLATLIYQVFFTEGAFSTFSIADAFSHPRLPRALLNTVLLTMVAGTGALAIGSVLAWLNERTDARLGWAAGIFPILPLMMPQLATAVGWSFLGAPRVGLLNVYFRDLFPSGSAAAVGSGPMNIFSIGGIVWVTVLITVPFAYLTVSAALNNMDPALEEASLMAGASPFRTLFRVTLPALRNAVATAAVLIVILIISIFSVPIIIGSREGIDVLSTLIFRLLFGLGETPRFGDAIVLSIFMFLMVQPAILLEYAIARKRRHARIEGRARIKAPKTSLGVLRLPARALMVVYLGCATVLPVIGLLAVSLQSFWSASYFESISLDNYVTVFGAGSALRDAFTNSLILGIGTATVLIIVAAVVAFYIQTIGGLLGRIVDGATALPASLPNLVVGVAFLVAMGTGERGLGGTLTLLFLAYLVLALPMASRAAANSLSQIGSEMWEAAQISGSSQLRTFFRVLFPLMPAGLLSGWIIVFAFAFSEISASVFLSRHANPVTGAAIVQVWNFSGSLPQLAALALAVTLVQAAVVVAFRGVIRRGFATLRMR